MGRFVAVIGGGISGLAAAEAVQRYTASGGSPARVVVFESDAVSGGKIKTAVDNGFVVETGPHGFLDREPKMFALINRLGLESELVSANTASARRFLVRDGLLREIPSSPFAFLRSDILPWSGKLRLLLEPFVPGRPDPSESVFDFAARRIGVQAADTLIDAMVTGIYGGDPRQLSLKSAFPRMYELERDYGGLVRALFALAWQKKWRERKLLAPGSKTKSPTKTKSPVGAPAGTLHSFRRGLGTLVQALAEKTEVHTRSEIRSIKPSAQGWLVRTPAEEIRVDAVVSTVPSYVLRALLVDFEPRGAEEVGQVPYVPCSVVVQCFDQAHVKRSTDGFGFLLPGREQRPVLGSIWASTVFPDHAPQGQVMFRTMIGGARNAELGRASKTELASIARAELNHWMGVDPRPEPNFEAVIPWPEAIPQYNLGHDAVVEAADGLESQYPGLFIGGNGFRGAALLACVAHGDEVGQRVAAHLSSLSSSKSELG